MSGDESSRFVRDAHAIVSDLLVPNRTRYWGDFLLTIAVAYTALAVYLTVRLLSPIGIAAMVVCALAIFRAVTFTHELAHRPTGFRGFAIAWNLLCGIPLLLPAFLYGDHTGHHVNHAYGTWADPEYLLHGARSRGRRFAFLLLALIYPLLPAVRFLFFTPLAAMSGRVDRFLWRYGSSLYVMNESYTRDDDRAARSASRWWQEGACSLWAWAAVALVVTGRVPIGVVGRAYLVLLFWMAVNQVRTLTAHRYRCDGDAPLTYLEQVLDTNTFPHGRWLPSLWAPLGLRYHALHHLMPSLPYHAMATAHRRLVAALPPGSPYHQTIRPGMAAVLVSMLGRSPSESC